MRVLLLVYLMSVLVSATIGVVAWRRRHATPAAGALAVTLAGGTWWAFVAMVAALAGPDLRSVITLGVYPGVGAVVAGFFCLCRALVDRDWRPGRRLLLLLAIEPVLISLAAATNGWHHEVLRPVVDTAEHADFGTVFWVHTLYSYALLTSGLVLVLRERRHAPALQTRQLTTVLLAAAVPVAGNLISLTGHAGTTDLTALFFVGTGLLNAHAVFRQGLFEVVPIARARVLERLDAAILVLDEQDRLGDVNSAALALLARAVPPGVPVVGSPAAVALGGLAPVLLGVGGEKHVQLSDVAADLDVRVTPLEDRRGRSIGRVLVVTDVSEATDARRLLTDSNVLLQQQLVMIERLRAELAEQAVRDPLTGLHNRRHLTTVLAAEVERARESGEPLSVVLLDVDHFKEVNDSHGHAAGDALLQALGTALQAAVRPGDTVARYGGEEFVVLLPGLDLAAAIERAEQIRAECRLIGVVGGLRPTLSAGVATSAALPMTPDELLEAADRALYRAKAEGRDRVVGPLLAG